MKNKNTNYMSNMPYKRKMNKTLKVLLITLASATICGAIGGISYYAGYVNGANTIETSTDNDMEIINSGVVENGVSIKCAFKANSGDAYGAYEITYTVTPSIYTDEIKAELSYSDKTSVPEDICSVTMDTINSKVTVHCKAAFTKQITLRLYAASNESVEAKMTFDFTEKITVDIPSFIDIVEGQIPTITPVVSTTGGTKLVDKEVKNVTYSWNSGFTDWVKLQAKNQITKLEKEGIANHSYQNELVGDLVGFTATDATNFFSTKFYTNDFLTSKGCKWSFEEMWSDDDCEDPWSLCSGTWYIGSASKTDFMSKFDGNTSIIDWTCSVNGRTYSKSFGLSLDAIAITGISVNSSGYTF